MEKTYYDENQFKAKAIVDRAFMKCSFEERKQLYLELMEWAEKELNVRESQIFIDALQQSVYTQDIQLELSLDKMMDAILGRKK